jgi:predicted RNase H-like nuclease (RuvC/YqgF family)
MTPKDDAAKSAERMKTEAIHAQAMQIKYLTERLIDTEDEVQRLMELNRTLQLKLTSANKTLSQLQERN